jgi:hypothetical protein
MLHFSCDLCGQPLDDRRYVAKLEVFPAFNPDALTDADLEEDHLQDLAQLLDEMEVSGATVPDNDSAKSFRFDLCPRCHAKFTRDPLGRDSLRRLNFSEN